MENKKKFLDWNMVLALILIFELIIFGIKTPNILKPMILFNGIVDYMPVLIISLFVTFVFITGNMDIQVASIVGLTSIIIGVLWQDFGFNIFIASVIGVLAAGICGLLSGFLIAYGNVQSMVITLGGSFLYSGVALLLSTLSSTKSYQGISGFPDSFKFIGKSKLFGVIPFQFVLFILLAILAYILLHKTKFGRKVYLVGVNPNAAHYSGINVKKIIVITFVLSAISAGISGVILTSYLGTAKSDLGITLTMDIITAVVLGGTLSTGGIGSIAGTFLSGLILAIFRFGMTISFGVSAQYLDVPIGILLLIVVIIQTFMIHPELLKKRRLKM